MVPTSPLCTSLYGSLILLVLNLGGMVEADGVKTTWISDDPREAALCLLQAENVVKSFHRRQITVILNMYAMYSISELYKQMTFISFTQIVVPLWCTAQPAFFFGQSHSMPDLNSSRRDWTWAPMFGETEPTRKSHSLLSWLFNNKTVSFISTSGKRIFWIGRRFYF